MTETLSASLRERMINGEIAPGEKVTEQRVADEYGVVRPIAKACQERLTLQGLLRRTASVSLLDAAEIDDLFFSGQTFESAAAAHRRTSLSTVVSKHYAIMEVIQVVDV